MTSLCGGIAIMDTLGASLYIVGYAIDRFVTAAPSPSAFAPPIQISRASASNNVAPSWRLKGQAHIQEEPARQLYNVDPLSGHWRII